MHLYSSGLSLKKTSERLLPFIKRNHVTVWNWIQKYKPTKKILQKKKKIQEFIIIDETLIKVGNQFAWLWIAIDSINKFILGIHISFERTILVAERFLNSLIKDYGKHSLSTDDGGTWYSYACKLLKIEHHIHSTYEKSIIERTIQYINDRTEAFDDYFPCRKDNYKLNHIKNWLKLFIDIHNKEVMNTTPVK